ncbi:MAG: cbb3-type cytochrome c oxidase subunit I [Chloroflexi bacterium]|nr:cbb3-type cytochrome c oxidase subunit I [Chloroflexota bacterium]
MTGRPAVNPKKLRPYDQPPRRRRSLIPSKPDNAATGFLVAAALWLALAGGIGALAIGIRIVPFEFSYPLPVFDLSFQVDARRIDYAFAVATVYGWLSNAAFAAVCFMTPRLIGRRLAFEPLLMLAVAIWNMSLLGGTTFLYVLDLGPHSALTSMFWLFDGGLAFAATLVILAFLVTAGASLLRGYISTWFAGVALLGLTGLVGLDALTFAILHYVVPRAVGLPLASAGLGILAFLTWLALVPLTGVGQLIDTSIPIWVTTIGAMATMLLLVPVMLTVSNLVMTMQGRWMLLFGAGTASLALISLAFLLATSLLGAIGALRSVDAFVRGTDWELGLLLWSAFGAFSFAAFAIADHALPRMLHRAWPANGLSRAQLWLAFGGAMIAGVALLGGGIAEASFLQAAALPEQMSAGLLPYRVLAFGGFGLVALAGLAHLVNLFLLYTTAEPEEYVVPGQSAPAAAH